MRCQECLCRDLWLDIKPVQGQSEDGQPPYTTQKPEPLLDRIITRRQMMMA